MKSKEEDVSIESFSNPAPELFNLFSKSNFERDLRIKYFRGKTFLIRYDAKRHDDMHLDILSSDSNFLSSMAELYLNMRRVETVD